jgi:hypothetical protein
LLKARSAYTTLRTSRSVGSYACASALSGTIESTATRSPPTLRTRSARIPVVVTTCTRSSESLNATGAVHPDSTSDTTTSPADRRLPIHPSPPRTADRPAHYQ